MLLKLAINVGSKSMGETPKNVLINGNLGFENDNCEDGVPLWKILKMGQTRVNTKDRKLISINYNNN